MRALASVGVFEESPDGVFALTPLGALRLVTESDRAASSSIRRRSGVMGRETG
jgi:hypothetical protein